MGKRTHSDSKKMDILKAAKRLFAEHGVDKTSVKHIGNAAGVTDAAIYKHFPSKQVVAQEVYTQCCQTYTRIIQHYSEKEGSFADRYIQLLHQVAKIYEDDQYGLLLLSQNCQWYLASDRVEYDQLIQTLADFIKQGIQNKEIPDQDPVITAIMIAGTITTLATYHQTNKHVEFSSLQTALIQSLCRLVGLN